MKTLPTYTVDLIEELDKLYPVRCIAPGQSLEEAHRYAGKREVIDLLKNRLQATEQRALRDQIKTP